jgi:TPR repeat protein
VCRTAVSQDANDGLSLHHLARIYEQSNEPNEASQARKLYEKAIATGHTFSTFNLAIMLLEGRGGAPNISKGEELLRSAIEAKDDRALARKEWLHLQTSANEAAIADFIRRYPGTHEAKSARERLEKTKKKRGALGSGDWCGLPGFPPC